MCAPLESFPLDSTVFVPLALNYLHRRSQDSRFSRKRVLRTASRFEPGPKGLYIPTTLSIVQIGISNRYRNNRKMSKPEITFKIGAVRASIFRNTAMRNGKEILFPKVVLEVRYKDKMGQWKGTNSLSLNDLPKSILALQKAFEYLMSKPSDQATPDPEQPQK